MYKDDTDEKIIQILKENSREPFADIGSKLGLSESAVRRRIKNLTDTGIISRFTVEVDDKKATSAIVLISVDSAADTSKVSGRLRKLEGVETIYEITGQYDIAVIVKAPTITEINTSIDSLRRVQGVSDTNSVIILKTLH